MSDVVEQVERALAAWEAAARAATPGPWFAVASGVEGAGTVLHDQRVLHNDAAHIALNDPAAVLALVAGIRAVTVHHRRWLVTDEEGEEYAACGTCDGADGPQPWPCPTLTALAAALPQERA